MPGEVFLADLSDLAAHSFRLLWFKSLNMHTCVAVISTTSSTEAKRSLENDIRYPPSESEIEDVRLQLPNIPHASWLL